jgi:hypothetical protein
MQKNIIKSLAVVLIGTVGGTYSVWQAAIKVPVGIKLLKI